MKRKTLRNLLLGILASCLLGFAVPAVQADEEEGETVEEIRKRIREQEEEARKEAKQEKEEEENSGCQLFAEILRILLDTQSEPSGADYPHQESRHFDRVITRAAPPGHSPWGYLGLDLDGAYLLHNRWSVAGRLTFNLQALHLHAFSQVLFDPSGYLACYAANAGVNFVTHNVIVNLFAGAFGTDLFTRALFSFGAETQVFLSRKCILELYSLNAVYYSLRFNFLSLSLHYAGNGMSLGVGFNLNYYAGILLLGPSIRLSFWL